MAFKQDVLTNEQIMKKYVVEGNYFKVDSIRQGADLWMDNDRNSLREVAEKDITIFKYSEHEEEFMVLDNPPSAPLSPASMRKLQIFLVSPEQPSSKVNLDNLYVMRTKNSKGGWFILFNEENKIVSFSGLRKGSRVSIWQW